jgi:hypothetical protein
MMDSQPNFALSIKNTPQVAPSNSKVWLSFNCFQVTCLVFDQVANSKKRKARASKAKQNKKAKAKQISKRCSRKQKEQWFSFHSNNFID